MRHAEHMCQAHLQPSTEGGQNPEPALFPIRCASIWRKESKVCFQTPVSPPWSGGGGRSISVSDVHTTRCQSRTHTEKPQAAELANTCCSSTRQDRDEPCSEHRCSSLTGSWCGKNRLGKQAASHPRWQSCYHPKMRSLSMSQLEGAWEMLPAGSSPTRISPFLKSPKTTHFAANTVDSHYKLVLSL